MDGVAQKNSDRLQDIDIKETKLNDPEAADLLAGHHKEVIGLYPGEAGIPPTAETLNVFILLKLDDKAIACGGLRLLSDVQIRTAELKRMYVLPAHRGKGNLVSNRLMTELEKTAIRHDWKILRLETGWDMWKARRYYERHGFREIPLFGHYIDDPNSEQSVCYEKIL